MKATDRNSKVYEISSPLIKEIINVGQLMPRVVNMLMMNQLLENKKIFYGKNCVYTLDEQYSALVELLRMSIGCGDIEDFDINMARKTILYAFDLDRLSMREILCAGALDKAANENLGDDNMEKEITTGTPIVNRNGNKYIAYSYLVTEFKEAMELLQKVDTFNMLENHEEESYDAMLEIVYRALNREYSKEELLMFIDAEFAQKAIRCYFNLQQVS